MCLKTRRDFDSCEHRLGLCGRVFLRLFKISLVLVFLHHSMLTICNLGMPTQLVSRGRDPSDLCFWMGSTLSIDVLAVVPL